MKAPSLPVTPPAVSMPPWSVPALSFRANMSTSLTSAVVDELAAAGFKLVEQDSLRCHSSVDHSQRRGYAVTPDEGPVSKRVALQALLSCLTKKHCCRRARPAMTSVPTFTTSARKEEDKMDLSNVPDNAFFLVTPAEVAKTKLSPGNKHDYQRPRAASLSRSGSWDGDPMRSSATGIKITSTAKRWDSSVAAPELLEPNARTMKPSSFFLPIQNMDEDEEGESHLPLVDTVSSGYNFKLQPKITTRAGHRVLTEPWDPACNN